MNERVVIERQGHVAEVRLNRPEKHNAVDRAMFEALADAGRSLAKDRSLRAVVLTGSGENFCAGIDVTSFTDKPGGLNAEDFKPREDSPANYYQAVAYVWRELPVPVIAALKGFVFGAGLQIALGADLRYAQPTAQLSFMETKWGIIPDMGITTMLPSLMPLDRALELSWSGRIVSGKEADELGLVTAVDDEPETAAKKLAAELARRSPDAIRASKRLLQEAWANRDAELLKSEAAWQLKVLAAPNQREAVLANMERREPEFSDAVV